MSTKKRVKNDIETSSRSNAAYNSIYGDISPLSNNFRPPGVNQAPQDYVIKPHKNTHNNLSSENVMLKLSGKERNQNESSSQFNRKNDNNTSDQSPVTPKSQCKNIPLNDPRLYSLSRMRTPSFGTKPKRQKSDSPGLPDSNAVNKAKTSKLIPSTNISPLKPKNIQSKKASPVVQSYQPIQQHIPETPIPVPLNTDDRPAPSTNTTRQYLWQQVRRRSQVPLISTKGHKHFGFKSGPSSPILPDGIINTNTNSIPVCDNNNNNTKDTNTTAITPAEYSISCNSPSNNDTEDSKSQLEAGNNNNQQQCIDQSLDKYVITHEISPSSLSDHLPHPLRQYSSIKQANNNNTSDVRTHNNTNKNTKTINNPKISNDIHDHNNNNNIDIVDIDTLTDDTTKHRYSLSDISLSLPSSLLYNDKKEIDSSSSPSQISLYSVESDREQQQSQPSSQSKKTESMVVSHQSDSYLLDNTTYNTTTNKKNKDNSNIKAVIKRNKKVRTLIASSSSSSSSLAVSSSSSFVRLTYSQYSAMVFKIHRLENEVVEMCEVMRTIENKYTNRITDLEGYIETHLDYIYNKIETQHTQQQTNKNQDMVSLDHSKHLQSHYPPPTKTSLSLLSSQEGHNTPYSSSLSSAALSTSITGSSSSQKVTITAIAHPNTNITTTTTTAAPTPFSVNIGSDSTRGFRVHYGCCIQCKSYYDIDGHSPMTDNSGSSNNRSNLQKESRHSISSKDQDPPQSLCWECLEQEHHNPHNKTPSVKKKPNDIDSKTCVNDENISKLSLKDTNNKNNTPIQPIPTTSLPLPDAQWAQGESDDNDDIDEKNELTKSNTLVCSDYGDDDDDDDDDDDELLIDLPRMNPSETLITAQQQPPQSQIANNNSPINVEQDNINNKILENPAISHEYLRKQQPAVKLPQEQPQTSTHSDNFWSQFALSQQQQQQSQQQKANIHINDNDHTHNIIISPNDEKVTPTKYPNRNKTTLMENNINPSIQDTNILDHDRISQFNLSSHHNNINRTSASEISSYTNSIDPCSVYPLSCFPPLFHKTTRASMQKTEEKCTPRKLQKNGIRQRVNRLFTRSTPHQNNPIPSLSRPLPTTQRERLPQQAQFMYLTNHHPAKIVKSRIENDPAQEAVIRAQRLHRSEKAPQMPPSIANHDSGTINLRHTQTSVNVQVDKSQRTPSHPTVIYHSTATRIENRNHANPIPRPASPVPLSAYTQQSSLALASIPSYRPPSELFSPHRTDKDKLLISAQITTPNTPHLPRPLPQSITDNSASSADPSPASHSMAVSATLPLTRIGSKHITRERYTKQIRYMKSYQLKKAVLNKQNKLNRLKNSTHTINNNNNDITIHPLSNNMRPTTAMDDAEKYKHKKQDGNDVDPILISELLSPSASFFPRDGTNYSSLGDIHTLNKSNLQQSDRFIPESSVVYHNNTPLQHEYNQQNIQHNPPHQRIPEIDSDSLTLSSSSFKSIHDHPSNSISGPYSNKSHQQRQSSLASQHGQQRHVAHKQNLSPQPTMAFLLSNKNTTSKVNNNTIGLNINQSSLIHNKTQTVAPLLSSQPHTIPTIQGLNAPYKQGIYQSGAYLNASHTTTSPAILTPQVHSHDSSHSFEIPSRYVDSKLSNSSGNSIEANTSAAVKKRKKKTSTGGGQQRKPPSTSLVTPHNLLTGTHNDIYYHDDAED